MICKNCIHYEICCNEGRDDEALTLCADFFEVVRCKDCKYHGERNGKKCCTRLEIAFPIMEDEDFCSRGERKETE